MEGGRLVREMKDGKGRTYILKTPNIELLAPSCIAALICYANAIYERSIGESQVKGFVDLIPANDRLITRKADIHQDCRSRAGTSKSEHQKRARCARGAVLAVQAVQAAWLDPGQARRGVILDSYLLFIIVIRAHMSSLPHGYRNFSCS